MNTLLIVDDSDADVEILLEALDDAGLSDHVQVITAKDGAEGERAIRHHAPDLVLLDLNMPKVDGFSLLEAIDDLWPNTRVVVYSTSTNDNDRRRALKLGGRAYVVKPSTYDGVVKLVKTSVAFWELAT